MDQIYDTNTTSLSRDQDFPLLVFQDFYYSFINSCTSYREPWFNEVEWDIFCVIFKPRRPNVVVQITSVFGLSSRLSDWVENITTSVLSLSVIHGRTILVVEFYVNSKQNKRRDEGRGNEGRVFLWKKGGLSKRDIS